LDHLLCFFYCLPDSDFVDHFFSFSAAASRGAQKSECSPARQAKGCAFLEGPERRNQNPQGGASRSRNPQSRQRAGMFCSSLCSL
jgi:hypothetical protein